MRRRLARTLPAAVLLLATLPAPVSAGEYAMATEARYTVDPSGGAIDAIVDVTFTNTLPDPPGQISTFSHVDLALQAGAGQVAARDDRGPLTVDLATSDETVVASVRTRSRVRYQRTVTFTLSYRLADAASPALHVRPEIVRFPAWGFGTSSRVTVQLPTGYDARADGDPMVTGVSDASLELSSGPIADPAGWLALITAVRPSELVTHSAGVALSSGTVDLQVRSWTEDAAWGEHTLAFLVKALPMLEAAIGLPYPRVGPLVLTEAAGGEASSGTQPPDTGEILVAFDVPDFTLLHQAAHIWINDQLAADRWIREGLASHYAARVAAQLGVDPPYEPIARAAELAADARPLVEWRVGVTGAAADGYGYAASWALVEQIAAGVGEARLVSALQRVVAGVPAYDVSGPAASGADGRPYPPVDTRRLLDQLAAVGGEVAEPIGRTALGTDAAAELAQRDAARGTYGRLLAAAGDWGPPDAVRRAMAAWRFDEAQSAMAAAAAWLTSRDRLLADLERAELVPPTRLRELYVADGGGPDAAAELQAEEAVVVRYLAGQKRATDPRGPLETIGLAWGDDPGRLLVEAAGGFTGGDLQAATLALDRLDLQMSRAAPDGVLRLVVGVLLLTLLGLGAGVALRRRSSSHYTAAP